MLQAREIVASSILTAQKVGSLSGHYDFTLNPYAGCAFGCSYCYVPKFPNARHDVSEWGKWLEIKLNAPELIRRDRASIFGSRIFFSSATDPYQYIELRYRLSRRCLEELLRYQPSKVTMHTRSHLMLQDIDLLKAFGRRLNVGVSLPTDDDSIRQEFEPNAPSIKRRLKLIRTLCEQGVEVYISMSPLLPCDPERLVALVSPYANKAWVDAMRWTEVNRSPHLLDKYQDFFEPSSYQEKVSTVRRLMGQANRTRLIHPRTIIDYEAQANGDNAGQAKGDQVAQANGDNGARTTSSTTFGLDDRIKVRENSETGSRARSSKVSHKLIKRTGSSGCEQLKLPLFL